MLGSKNSKIASTAEFDHVLKEFANISPTDNINADFVYLVSPELLNYLQKKDNYIYLIDGYRAMLTEIEGSKYLLMDIDVFEDQMVGADLVVTKKGATMYIPDILSLNEIRGIVATVINKGPSRLIKEPGKKLFDKYYGEKICPN